MVASRFSFLPPLLLVACLACLLPLTSARPGTPSRPSDIVVTLDAALTDSRGRYLKLFFGADTVDVNLITPRVYPAQPISDSYLRPWVSRVSKIQAACSDGPNVILYGPRMFCRVSKTKMHRKKSCSKYKGNFGKFLGRSGPDASAKKGGKQYLFKGCQYIIKKNGKKWTRPKNLTAMGLPCHVDAAWTNGTRMALVRGDRLWWWMSDNSLEGPVPFESVVPLAGWTVKPYDGPED